MVNRDRASEQFGEYRLLRLLGKGGFAEVYLAEHVRLQTKAAIKLLLAHIPVDEQQRFLEEARKVAHLDHSHIVRVLDYSEQQDEPFLVMQYAPGGSLHQRHPVGTPLSIETILPYVHQVAEALQYAHDQRIIHLDVKPENMLLDARGNVLLADFGIALALSHTKTHQTLRGFTGTPLYAAPEQLQAKPGLMSDQYALATTVYRWLTGVFPFTSSDIFKKLQNTPPPLRTYIPHLTQAVEQVVLCALAKDPKDRFPSVREFAEALAGAYRTSLRPALGTLLLTSTSHTEPVTVAWSPDGKFLASAGEDRTIQVWDATSGQIYISTTLTRGKMSVADMKCKVANRLLNIFVLV